MSRRLRAAVALAAAGTVLLPAAAQAAPAMRLGVTDYQTIQAVPAQRPAALQNLVAARGTTLRVIWAWAQVERRRPPDAATARDPAFAGYDWGALDGVVRDSGAAGVELLLTFFNAPAWQEGPNRPKVSDTAPAGSWRPDPAGHADFLRAAARRYDGTYPDPATLGATLPRVRFWQVWNEPNLPNSMSPQWTRTGPKRYREASPAHYKKLLNAAYLAIHEQQPDATVVTAGTAPYGEPWRGGTRMPAAHFWRKLLCVDGRAKLRARNCRKDPVRFDAAAHHPYPIGPPGRKAINPDDVVVPDFPKITRPISVAVKAGNVRPAGAKPMWATELSWDSNPPDPGGIEIQQQARYLAGAIYVLWRQGVDAMMWWNLRDAPRGRGYEFDLQSGLYLRGSTVAEDRPKPAVTAMRFPFVAYRRYEEFRGRGTALLWGMAPKPGSVRVQRQVDGRWRTVRMVRANSHHVFTLRLSVGRGTRLRAVQQGEASIDAKVF